MSFETWYKGLPPVTRTIGTVWASTSIALQFGLLVPRFLYHDWDKVFAGQVWRPVTSFSILGGFSFNTLIKLVLLFQHGTQLEKGVYDGRPADYLYFITFCMSALIGLSGLAKLFLPLYVSLFWYNSMTLLVSIIYVWAREFPNNTVSFYGIFQVQSYYMPFMFALGEMLFGNSILPHIVGIFVGHMYYFFNTLYPRKTGRAILRTPAAFKTLTQSLGWERPPPNQARPEGYRPFQGRGYKIAAD